MGRLRAKEKVEPGARVAVLPGKVRRRAIRKHAAAVMATYNAKAAHRQPARILAIYKKFIKELTSRRFIAKKEWFIPDWRPRKHALWNRVSGIVEHGEAWR